MQNNNEVITVGAYEAKTNLPAILDKVEQGREYIITRHGKEVARLLPSGLADEKRKKRSAEAMKKSGEARERCVLGGVSWKELRDAGRRYLD